jgi:3-deoxy-D-manno-octulosonic-acid transferase
MIFLYNIGIALFRAGLSIASFFHPKAELFVTGRKNVFQELKQKVTGDPMIWIHCASLGEFEQGRPIIESLKKEIPFYKIILTFFSPSGYEVRKDYKYADIVTYLPIDTAGNAQRFMSIVKPAMAIFVKYEFWHHYASELRRGNVPLICISTIFRKEQLFFSPLGGFYRNVLKNFSHLFVQNNESVNLLRSIGITNVTLSGDTRFDRVQQLVRNNEPLPVAGKFKNNQKVFVVGSCWPEDIEVLAPFINERKLKFILAPHEISEDQITAIEESLQVRSIRYSHAVVTNPESFDVLIIDNVGMLSRLYAYGEFAFVGGAFGKGLHNILEAACYGIPIMFGNRNYKKFREAVDLMNRGGAFEVQDYADLKMKYELLNDPGTFLLACEVTRQYVEENIGATDKIMEYCRKILKEN